MVQGDAMELIDRHVECGVLDRLVEAIRGGQSRALVVSGEAGVGKTALLEYVARQASGCRLARIAGVQSEMELPFAALHQLCEPMLDKLQGLPVPQRDALEIAPVPSTAEVRAWARSVGLEVPDRGQLRPGIWQAGHDANAPNRA